jgi:hypothetical protein
MGDVPGGTTGKRQARAFTSFIEAANFRSKCLVIKQAKRTFAATSTAGNIIAWLACAILSEIFFEPLESRNPALINGIVRNSRTRLKKADVITFDGVDNLRITFHSLAD